MIVLDYKSSKPIYEQIIEQVKFNVMKGYLKPGDAIPSVRRLALELKITPGTVSKAYQELERQEIIETVRGKGTFIAAELTAKPDEAKLLAVKKRLQSEMMELKMMGFDKNGIVDLVKGIYEEMSLC
ncbi:MAG: GntR family transcriptional regulator [Clostridium sp.]|nr:GntR family transcriptional regulator [Clostridium sp.]